MSLLIVGSGVIGCAIACELAGRGAACTVIDDRPVAGGATQASAGMLAPYVEAHEPGPLRDLGVRSLALYDDWIADLRTRSSIDVEYRRIGTLEVALDPMHASEMHSVATSADRGTPRTYVDAAAARVRYPALGSIDGALLTPAHGYVDAPQLTAALAEAARRSGAVFEHGRVRAVRPGHGGRLEVTTEAKTITAESVVLAAGAWAGHIAIDGVALPPIRPVRGQLLHLGWTGTALDTIVWGPECYVVPRIDGSVLVGATVEDVGFDERATASGVRDLLDAACELLPAGWGASFLGVRVGLRPASPDDLPVLGPDPRLPGLVHATGHYRNGVLLAPITAQLIADWVVEGQRDPVLDVLGPDRFTAER